MRVLLVQMPFFTLDTASISLSLVKAAVEEAGDHCDLRYLNLEFGRRLGSDLYTWVAGNSPPYLLFGDLLFAQSLHGETVSKEELRALAAPLRTPGVPEITPEIIESFPELCRAATQFIDDQLREVSWTDYDLVGFNTMFQIAPVLAMAKRVKELPGAPRVILGGSYCESEMGEQLCGSFPFVDFVCCTEGEGLIVELVRHLSGEGVALADIPGLVFRADGKVVKGGARPRSAGQDPIPAEQLRAPARRKARGSSSEGALDHLPIPTYGDWLEQARSSQLLAESELRLPLETSRGCWWGQVEHCTFCGLNGSNMSYRGKSAARALKEISSLAEYGVKRVHAVDDILDHRYFKTVLPALVEQQHDMQLFYEIKSNVTYEQARLLADSGIGWVQPGIESLSTEILKLMRKGVTAVQNLRLLRWGAELEIGLAWNLLYGFPGERPEEFDQMAALVPALTHLQPPYIEVCQVRLHRFSPLFVDRDAMGIENVRPTQAYYKVFPFDREVVSRMAYYFEHEYRDHPDPNSYIQPLARAVRGWHEEAGQAAFVSLRRGDVLRLVDTRRVAHERVSVLRGLERDVYLACDHGATAEAIAAAVGRPFEELQPLLQTMTERRWIVHRDGQWLALAVPMDKQVPPHVPAPLLDGLMVRTHQARMQKLASGISGDPPTLDEFRERGAAHTVEP